MHPATSEVTAQSGFDLQRIDAQRVGQIEQVVPFLLDDFAQYFSMRELAQHIRLPIHYR